MTSISNITSTQAGQVDTFRSQMQSMASTATTAAAKALNMDADSLRDQLRSGTALKSVAAAQGVDFGKVQSAITDAVKPQIDQAVSAGQLTSSQASDVLSTFTSGDAPAANKLGSGGGTNRVHHGGGGPHPPAGAASSTSTSATSAADQAKLDAAAALKKLEATNAELKLEAAAAAVKLDASKLIEKLKSGESLKSIADSAGVDFSKVQNAIDDAGGGSGYSASGVTTGLSTGTVVDAAA
jgi:trimeric autotransporter adhesin